MDDIKLTRQAGGKSYDVPALREIWRNGTLGYVGDARSRQPACVGHWAISACFLGWTAPRTP